MLNLRHIAALAFLAGCQSVSAQTSRDVSFDNSQGIRLTGKLYRTAWSGARPAVVLLHGCAGIYSYSDPAKGIAMLYTEWAKRLTNTGYVVLLVDSFTPRSVPQNQCANGAVGVSEVSDRPHDAYAALAYLRRHNSKVDVDDQRVALIGWSHGGSSAFSTLSDTMDSRAEGRFRAGFAFYPGCGLYNAFGGISTSTYVPYAPLTILHGDADPLYTVGYCQTRVQRGVELGADGTNGKSISMIAYSGAKHSFDNARQVTSEFTIYDVNAKTSADAEIMNGLAAIFQ